MQKTPATGIPSLDDQTPLMKQYWELKSKIPDGLLLFRMGDFYELFGDDAVLASQILEITLTSRDRNKPNPIPMAGVPHHSVQNYIQKLLKAGKKVAIGEQMEDPELVKGTTKIVRREIVRVLTPAVQFDAEGAEVNYLATTVRTSERGWILACLDVSTGETLLSAPLDLGSLSCEISKLSIRHFLKTDADPALETLPLPEGALVETLPKNYVSLEKAEEILKAHYEVGDLQAFISTSAGSMAIGILVTYALRTQQQERIAHLRFPEPLQKPSSMTLGPNTPQHLDLPELFQLINQTRSTLGARQLKRWLAAPLRQVSEIQRRQSAVQDLARSAEMEKLSAELSKLYDLERITGRVNTRLANPRDTYALGASLACIPVLCRILDGISSSPERSAETLVQMKAQLQKLGETLNPLWNKITSQQLEEAPLTARDGGIFKQGTTPELDRLLSLTQDGQRWLIELELREREKTGIPSLKVRYNRVFGYYLEVTQAHLKNVPSHYQRKQTMVGAERFFTEELKKFEEEILTASSKQKSLEQELFQQLLEEIQKLTLPIMETARVFGELDALLSLARMTALPGWCMPVIDESLDLKIEAGRHPMVDAAKRGHFVPNSVELSPQTQLTLLITGPNMGGKSTVMRQTALILILGQMGAPVPAQSAKWGFISSLFTRIGAQDAIARGQSTFMVEMSELAHILHHADERSFLVLDEIGRGTSTYDGISVAWATLEWICNQSKSRTLFATHYHELIQLASTLPLLANAHMAVEGAKSSNPNGLRFLYELRSGPTNESFGIQVAQMAGLPKPVIQRAWKVLEELEAHAPGAAEVNVSTSSSSQEVIREEDLEDEGDSKNQLSLFSLSNFIGDLAETKPHPVLKELENSDPNAMTPIQALNFVVKLKEQVSQSL